MGQMLRALSTKYSRNGLKALTIKAVIQMGSCLSLLTHTHLQANAVFVIFRHVLSFFYFYLHLRHNVLL